MPFLPAETSNALGPARLASQAVRRSAGQAGLSKWGPLLDCTLQWNWNLVPESGPACHYLHLPCSMYMIWHESRLLLPRSISDEIFMTLSLLGERLVICEDITAGAPFGSSCDRVTLQKRERVLCHPPIVKEHPKPLCGLLRRVRPKPRHNLNMW